jgi:hypothetical protein
MKDVKFSDFSKAKVGVKPSRLRVTQLQDLIALLRDALAIAPADAMLALMMLCHGTRIGETRQAQWSHISLAEREWFIPAENTKTGVEHHLPLTDQVRQMLMTYRETQWASGYAGQYLFPSRNGKALSEGQASAVFTRLGQGEWTSHDLRKVARTGWADIGVDHLIGELLINHAMGHNVKVYIQSDVMSRKREALDRWCAYLEPRQRCGKWRCDQHHHLGRRTGRDAQTEEQGRRVPQPVARVPGGWSGQGTGSLPVHQLGLRTRQECRHQRCSQRIAVRHRGRSNHRQPVVLVCRAGRGRHV